MSEKLYNWVADRFSDADIIDLIFVVSNLVDIPLSEAELCETACFDTLTMRTVDSINANKNRNIPMGKFVI